MNGICNYLGHQTLIDLCEGSDYYTIGAAVGVTVLTAYAIAKVSGYARPKLITSAGESSAVKTLEGRVTPSINKTEDKDTTPPPESLKGDEGALNDNNEQSPVVNTLEGGVTPSINKTEDKDTALPPEPLKGDERASNNNNGQSPVATQIADGVDLQNGSEAV